MEKLFRHIGFINYLELPAWDVVLHAAPEVIALLTSFFVYVLCDHLNPRDPDNRDNAEQGILMVMMQSSEGGGSVRQSQMKRKAVIALTIIGESASIEKKNERNKDASVCQIINIVQWTAACQCYSTSIFFIYKSTTLCYIMSE